MQVNSPRLKSNVASKWASKYLWRVQFILLLMVHRNMNFILEDNSLFTDDPFTT